MLFPSLQLFYRNNVQGFSMEKILQSPVKFWRGHPIHLKYMYFYSVLCHFTAIHSDMLSTSSMFIDIQQ